MKRSVKLLALIVFLIAAVMPTLSSCKNADETSKYPVYTSYRDIPGVTTEEISAVEALKSSGNSFVFAMNESTEAFAVSEEKIGGFTALFCEWLTALFGIDFTPRICSWDELISGLSDGSIHFTSELTATEERKKIYEMSGTVAERTLKYFRLEGALSFAEIEETRKVRFGFLDGSTGLNFVKDSYEGEFESFDTVGDYDEAVEMLQNGEIDAFFEDGSAEAAFDKYQVIKTYTYYPLIYAPVSLTTGTKSLAPIISVMQKYLDKGALFHLVGLYNKGHQEYLEHKLNTRLTEEEKAYLQEIKAGSGIIHYGAEFDNYPYSFYNEKEKEFQGIAVDVLDEIGKLTGISFVPKNNSDTTWTEILSMLDSGEISLVTELIPSEARKDKYLWPKAPYAADKYALVSKQETPDIKPNQIVYSKIAIPKDTAFEELFKEWFPYYENAIYYDTTNECFDALEKGEVDFVMASQNLLLCMTNYFEKPGYKVNLSFDKIYQSAFGLNLGETELCSIVGKAQEFVEINKITESWQHRVFDYSSAVVKAQRPYLILISAALACITVLIVILLVRNRQMNRKLETTIKIRTAELETQTLAAQEASKTKSEFLARMSHEIRTPLNAIIGMAEIAKQKDVKKESTGEAVSQILTASSHLLGIINDVLDMSKIESGKFQMAENAFSLKQAMGEVVDLISDRCEERKITFLHDCSSLPELAILGDKLRLKQVLINLLGNAVKFTHEGGEVALSATVLDMTDSSISIFFSVKDNGIGMSEEQLSRLFTAFEQTDSSIAVRFGGTGLGLAISQNLVQSMGGTIVAESLPQQGSTFSFSLTFSTAELPSDEEASAPSANSFAGKRILLVEDIEINRIILIELLSDTQVDIEEAENGLVALEMFEKAPDGYYDLIFMDIQMPEMDGYAATRMIRSSERPYAKTVPIIAMTANAYKEDVDRALESGMNGHLSKPIEIDSVKKTLAKYLNLGG